MAELEISEAQVPPEALAAFNQASAPAANEVEIDPVDALDSAGLFELSKNKMFSPLEYAQQNPEKATNPDVVRKLADTHARIRERGFTFADLPSVGEAAKGVGHMIAGGAKQLWNYANAFIGVPLAGVAGAITGQPPTFAEELTQDAQRRMIETAAGTEAAITGLSQLPGRAISKIVHRAGTISGLGKPYDQQTEQEKSKAFFGDLGKAQAASEIAQGRGGLVGAISGETQKELAAAGKPIRPEEVQTLAAGDPLSFILFGKAFGAAGGAASRVLPKTGAGAALVEKAGEAATTLGGRTIQTAGKVAEFGGGATKLAGKVLPVVGALKGTALFGAPGTIGGLAAGATAGRAAQRIGQTIGAAGERLAGFGEQVATGVGLTPYSQAARDILAASPIVASETLKGGAFDLALAAATSESPQETEAAAAFGTVLGGLKGVGRGALKVAQGQIITPRPWGSPKVTPAYGSFAALDALHSQASVSAAPGQALRANAIREFLSGAGNKVQAYLMPDAAAMEKAVTDILVRQGEAPAVAQATARSAAQAKGMFTGELLDDKGNSRRVVLLNEADAAPHEAFHGIQDVLGESANQVVDGLVFQEYAPQWEAIGQQYAQRLGGTGSWREIILDRTGWGNAAAAEKALRDAANKIEAETGAAARPEDVRALAEGVLASARRNGAGWRDILTPEEATAEANRYLARELAAENFDAAFKALGSGLVEGNTLPEALARVIARTAQFMGVEPLAGARTEGLRIEPRLAVTETVTGLGRSLVEPAAPATKPAPAPKAEVSRWAKKSTTPEVADSEADKVLTWLQTASIPVANRAAAAQTLAEAMKNQQGVRLTYFGAKGEPGGDPAALRPERRAEIEAQRDAPNADRPIVTKDYFPYGAIITSKGPQFKGWSPNNFNANVTRFADWITKNSKTLINIPMAHDLTTEAGKRGLQADLQTFIQNQMAGFTGSGLEVVVPEGTGATAPVRTGVQPVALPQERADVISYLFNLKLPETPRITAGKLPLNIVGQRVSEATLPGRVVEPVRPRQPFTGPQAERLGIAGEQIREVNPFRQTVEQAAKDAGVKPPELIEAAQILALDRIAFAEPAPELPQFGGNVLTLTAGFLPGEIAQRGREILAMTPDEFQARSRDWSGGLTGEAKRIGLGATSIEDVNALRQFEAEAKAKGATAMKARDFDTAMSQASVSQFFREAREAATGTGGIGEALRRDLGEAYVPPVSEATPTATTPAAETSAQFLPKARKPKNEFKILPAGAAGVSKAWVLPGGKVEQLGPQWHHDWLDKNKAVQEKYGLEVPPFEGGDAEGVREAALKKGFVRVNYSRNTGTLTVEARAQNWRRQKGAVEKLIEENLDDIDNVTVHLMDENVQCVVDSASERLFNYDSDVEKMANLPFITKGEVRGGGAQFLPRNTEIEKIATSHAESEGFTFNPPRKFARYNRELARKLADEYSAATHSPDDPKVRASYEAFIDETKKQYQAIEDAGYVLEPIESSESPYKLAGEIAKDVRENKHLAFNLTEEATFQTPEGGSAKQLMLEPSGVVLKGKELSVNDLFRAVHDFFGHAATGNSFGPQGEFNAWGEHSALYSKAAQGALAAETIGQVATTHFNRSLRNERGELLRPGDEGFVPRPERPYAPQKNIVISDELIAEARSQFLPPKDKAFVEELEKIRKGESGGQTFNADGSIWQPPAEPSDIVTLASTTIPREKLAVSEFKKATEPYQELLAQPNIAAGVFSFEQAGKPVTSIDINAVVPQTFRENTLAFARANDQVAIWDAAKNETVNTGGSGNTRITSPEQMRAAAEALAAGEPVDVAALTETTGQFLPAEQAGLPGITSGREYDRKAIEGMSQAQLKEYFPEAIIPKKNTEFISDNIVGSPLAKAAGSREAAVQAFADKLVRDYRSRQDDPMVKAGEKWYSEFTPLLKKEFGKDSRIFAELLAATSPNNPPSTNFAFALDALRNWKAGRYDKMIAKFNEGLNKLPDGGLQKVYERDLKAGKVTNPPAKPSDATYLAHWIEKHNLIPRSSSGGRFSMHSVPVLKVLARKWMTLNTGPKTDNFIKNLVGEGDEATIDLWAARTLRRLGYEGFQKRWRILPRNKTGVSDEDFVFSQQVFRKAADELGIKPSALQGAMWYREKQLWSERGWGKLDLGDYKTEVERMPQLRAGFESREARARAEAEAGETEQLEILPR